jgi:gluconate kinase
MPPALLGSQFAALEAWGGRGGLSVDVERPAEEVLEALLAGMARL